MKKFCFLLLIILLMPWCSAESDFSVQGEILFRGLPWDISAIDFLDAVAADVHPDLSDSQKERSIRESDSLGYFDAESEFCLKHIDVSIWGARAYSVVINANDDFCVAGYPVASIHAKAVSAVRNGEVLTGPENSRLINAEYALDHLRIADMNAAKTDLLRKISDLYGEYDVTRADGINVYHVWYGENNTYAQLYTLEDADTVWMAQISYGITNAEEIIECIKNPTLTIDEANYDGL